MICHLNALVQKEGSHTEVSSSLPPTDMLCEPIIFERYSPEYPVVSEHLFRMGKDERTFGMWARRFEKLEISVERAIIRQCLK